MTAASSVRTGGRTQWEQAGEAWGHRANDWSCLFEHYSIDVVLAMFGELAVGPGIEILDLACGSGLSVRLADATGARAAGIDASSELIEVARCRTPGADLRVGSMFELPWADASFDAVVSVNGVWGGCDRAVAEAFRVLRPGGGIALSFWGLGPPLDLRACFKVFAAHAPQEHKTSMRTLNNIATPGVAEAMLTAAGFDAVRRGQRVSVTEWPDIDTAWRALSSVGPAVPALRHGDEGAIRSEVVTALEACRDERGVYRFRNDHQYVIARKPPAA